MAAALRWVDAQPSARFFLFGALVRAAHAVRGARSVHRRRFVRCGGRLLGRAGRQAVRTPAGEGALRQRDDRILVGSRRGARRPRRGRARHLSLPRDHSGATHREAARFGACRRAPDGAGAAHRSGADHPGAGRPAGGARSGDAGPSGPLAASPHRRLRPDRRPVGLLRVAVPSPALRLERTLCAHGRALPLHPRPEGRALRSHGGSARAPVGGRRASAGPRRDALRTGHPARPRRRQPPIGDLGRGPPEAGGARLRGDRDAQSGAGGGARRSGGRPEGQDPRVPGVPPRHAAGRGGAVRGGRRRCTGSCSARIRD